MHSFFQKSVSSLKTSNGRTKTNFSITKGKNGIVHKIEGMRSSNSPNNLLVHESIRALNKKSGRIHGTDRVFKIKSSDIMNLLKESNKSIKTNPNKKIISLKIINDTPNKFKISQQSPLKVTSSKKKSVKKVSTKKNDVKKISISKSAVKKESKKNNDVKKISVKKSSVKKESKKNNNVKKINVKKNSVKKISIKKEQPKKNIKLSMNNV